MACVNPHFVSFCILGNLYFLLCLMFHVLMLCPYSLYRSSQFSTLWIVIGIPVRNLPLVRYSTVPHSCLSHSCLIFCLFIGTTSFTSFTSFIHSYIRSFIQVIRGNNSPYHSTLIYDQSGRQSSNSGNIWSFELELVNQLYTFHLKIISSRHNFLLLAIPANQFNIAAV